MSESRTINFILQVAVPDNDAKATDGAIRDLLHELRTSKLAAAYPQSTPRDPQGAESNEPWISGGLRVAVEPASLPKLLEFVYAWALRRDGAIVRLRLQHKTRPRAAPMVESERYRTFTLRARDGRGDDVDYLMQALEAEDDIATAKLVDFALSLVDTEEGKEQLRRYLYEGTLRQRNYAALYFKRLGVRDLLEEAVRRGCVSAEQAFSQ